MINHGISKNNTKILSPMSKSIDSPSDLLPSSPFELQNMLSGPTAIRSFSLISESMKTLSTQLNYSLKQHDTIDEAVEYKVLKDDQIENKKALDFNKKGFEERFNEKKKVIKNSLTSFENKSQDLLEGAFEYLDNENVGKVPVTQVLIEMQNFGLDVSFDSRIYPLYQDIYNYCLQHSTTPMMDSSFVEAYKYLTIDLQTFKEICTPHENIVVKCLSGQLCIPKFSLFCNEVSEICQQVLEECTKNLKASKDIPSRVLTSIRKEDFIDSPKNSPLASNKLSIFCTDKKRSGFASSAHLDIINKSLELEVSICTIDGQRFYHDHGKKHSKPNQFRMEGISKPLIFCKALEDDDSIEDYILHEPSGLPSDSLSLQGKWGIEKPFNPLMTSGALLSCSFISKDLSLNELFDQLFTYSKTKPDFNANFHQSKRSDMNRILCIAHMLADANCFPPHTHVDEVVELYHQFCSIPCTVQDLSLFAATLANGGIHPISHQRIFNNETVRRCLSVMFSCGHGIYSGDWAFNVGVPASTCPKNGVILVIIPGVMGLCTYSPQLDASGGVTQGTRFCMKLSKMYNFHHFDNFPVLNIEKKDPTQNTHGYKDQCNIHRLLKACGEGDICEVRRLKAQGVDLNTCNYDQRTALHLAASEGKLSIVKYLIKHHVILSPIDRFGGTPLSDAINNNHHHVISLLENAIEDSKKLEKKKNLDESVCCTIHDMKSFYAVYKGDLNELKELVEHHGVNLNARDYDWRTPLHIAASYGHVEIVEYLLKQNVNVSALDHRGKKPIDEARKIGNIKILELLDANRLNDEQYIKLKTCSQHSSIKKNVQGQNEFSTHSANHFLSSGKKDDGRNMFQIEILRRILEDNGLLQDDPRLKKLMEQTKMLPSIAILSFDEYCHLTESGAILLDKAIEGNLVISEFTDFCDGFAKVYETCKLLKDGEVAKYIPQLAFVDPEKFGVSICSVDGQRFNLGDSQETFSLQSCCKPISYCIALEEVGLEKVNFHIGCEPSGLSFNELSLLNKHGYRKPHNPMINAGAIMSSSLIKKNLPMHLRFEYVMKKWGELCGNPQNVHFNNSIYLSERETCDRNYCLGYMMKEADCLPDDTNLNETLDFYLQQCSISMNTEALSIVAATLANGGICPLTNLRVFESSTVRHALSMMHSCGMYDYSGSWSYKIGVPAKSGVSGAILVIIPNVLGLCVWSPKLDVVGNSVRGVAFCEQLIKNYSFHPFDLTFKRSLNNIRLNKDQNGYVAQVLHAVAYGQINDLYMLKLKGANFRVMNSDKRNALHIASCMQHFEMIPFLLNHDVDVNAKDRWGKTPLDYAMSFNNIPTIELLKKAMSNPSTI